MIVLWRVMQEEVPPKHQYPRIGVNSTCLHVWRLMFMGLVAQLVEQGSRDGIVFTHDGGSNPSHSTREEVNVAHVG